MRDDFGENRRDQLSTMGELAAVLAHEIKNPMNSIMINLEVLRGAVGELTSKVDKPELGQKAQKYLDVIEGEMKRLDKVIRGFLDLASPEQSTRTKINFNSLIRGVVEFMNFEFKQKNTQIILQLQDDLPCLVGSADQMKQAIINLLLNSLQAIKQPGGKIEIQSASDTKTIQIRVKDNGIGIPESILSQIFSPYFTTKEKGSGLGLSIVRRIVRNHGGYVDVESKEGEGTVLSLTFPVSGGSL